MDISPQKIHLYGCYVGLPRLDCLHRKYCIFISVKVKYTKLLKIVFPSFCAIPQFSFTKTRRNLEPYWWGPEVITYLQK